MSVVVQCLLMMLVVSLGATSPTDDALLMLKMILKDAHVVGPTVLEKSKLTISIIRHTTFPHKIGDLPMQACVRVLKEGTIEYLLGCETSEYEEAERIVKSNDSSTFNKSHTGRPYCHFFTKYDTDPTKEAIVNQNVQYYPWANQLQFHKFSGRESGFYGCYIGTGTRPWQWKHTGWTLFYSKPNQNLVDNTNKKAHQSVPDPALDPAMPSSPAPKSNSLLSSVRRRGPPNLPPPKKTEL